MLSCTVLASDPNIVVDPDGLSFTAYESGANPNPNILTISNTGGGVLNWSITDVNEAPFSPPDWLTVTPTSGSLDPNESEPVTLLVDISGLAAGQYSYEFDVVDPAAANIPQTITVDLEVVGPILDVSSNAFLFLALEGGAGPDPNILTISNAGGATLNWSITDVNEVTFSPPEWLTVTPTTGSLGPNQSEPVTLSVDSTGLVAGQYSYAFEVANPLAAESPQSVSIELFIGDSILGDINVPIDYPFIQSAINAAAVGDVIMVFPGTYVENINFNGKDIILTSTNPEDPNVVAATIVDGNGDGSVVTFSGTETPACELTGLTITNGNANNGIPWSRDSYGGGVNGNGTLATISQCVVSNNSANLDGNFFSGCGGGLANCDGTISNCIISENIAYDYGDFDGGYLGYGGGLYGCGGTIINCTIVGNTVHGKGGGLYGCHGLIANCKISSNTAYPWRDAYSSISEGGGLASCSGLIINCTITGNTSSEDGGGLARCNGPISNCIIWANRARDLGDQLYSGSTPKYSCIQDWTGGGTGNITSDPLFADPGYWDDNGPSWDWVEGKDYHLKSEHGRWDPNQWVYDGMTSPCIDAGDPADLNWHNELWPHGGRINMGAYGGTPQASMSANPVGNIADIDHDDTVGVLDLELFCEDWLLQDSLLDTDFDLNGVVNIADFAEFAAQWLWVEP
jgi:hypothetical protein